MTVYTKKRDIIIRTYLGTMRFPNIQNYIENQSVQKVTIILFLNFGIIGHCVTTYCLKILTILFIQQQQFQGYGGNVRKMVSRWKSYQRPKFHSGGKTFLLFLVLTCTANIEYNDFVRNESCNGILVWEGRFILESGMGHRNGSFCMIFTVISM